MNFIEAHPLAIFLGVAASIVALVFYLEWKRRRDLGELAASMGLIFSKDGPDIVDLAGTGLELFRSGHSRRARNMIEAHAGSRRIQVFDYKYRTGYGKNSHTYNFTVALIHCAAAVPDFDLKPETFIHKIGEMIGFKDIDLPAFPEFSRKYRLTGPDEKAVHMFFTPARAAWFEQNQGLRVQGGGHRLLLLKGNGRLPASSWQGFIEEAKAFVHQMAV